MNPLKPTFKFKTNVPADIHFRSSKPRTGTGQYGQWFRYDVIVNGEEQALFASKGLQERLEKLEDFSGKNLKITKREGEDGRLFWKIEESEKEKTETPPYFVSSALEGEEESDEEKERLRVNIENLEKRLNKASVVVKDLTDRLEKAEEDIDDLRDIIKGPKGQI